MARGIADEADADELSLLIPRALEFDGYVLALGFGFHERARVGDVSPAWIETHTAIQHLDPVPRWLSTQPSSSVFHIRGLPPAVGNAVYEEFIKTELSDGMVGMMQSVLGEPLFFVGYRKGRTKRAAGKTFKAHHVAEHSSIQAPLERAVATRTALAAAMDPGVADIVGTVDVCDDSITISRGAHAFFSDVLGGPLRAARRARLHAAVRRWVAMLRRGSRSRPLVAGTRIELAVKRADRRGVHAYTIMLVRDARWSIPDVGPWQELIGPRQRFVVAAAARGLANEAIAIELGVTVETVRTHLERAYRLLGVSSRTELAALVAAR
ncbi:MAG: LuxR C-terminal-related transcriptional regulator [Kofleriaceae bacterium]